MHVMILPSPRLTGSAGRFLPGDDAFLPHFQMHYSRLLCATCSRAALVSPLSSPVLWFITPPENIALGCRFFYVSISAMALLYFKPSRATLCKSAVSTS